MNIRSSVSSRSPNETGFGMIEIVVSMLLLSLLAIAFLPMLVTSLRVSVSNSTLASATQLVASEMESIRFIQEPTCAKIVDYATALNLNPPVFDQQGRVLEPYITVGACPADFPGTISVSVRVGVDDSTSTKLADATTLIFVTG